MLVGVEDIDFGIDLDMNLDFPLDSPPAKPAHKPEAKAGECRAANLCSAYLQGVQPASRPTACSAVLGTCGGLCAGHQDS